MGLLRPLSILLRNALIKQHPYFSCCASCGEIKKPLEGRLCTSLEPGFPVDAVMLPSAAQPEQNIIDAALLLRKQAPWIRSIIVVSSFPPALKSSQELEQKKGILLLRPDSLQTPGPGIPVEALLHTIPTIAEHFLIIQDASIFARPRKLLDFFTPNGIPLVAANSLPLFAPGAKGDETVHDDIPAYGQTREISAAFLSLLPAARRENAADKKRALSEQESPLRSHVSLPYSLQLALWTYEQALSIPSPLAAPASQH